jgi:signal transduction histidine kinase
MAAIVARPGWQASALPRWMAGLASCGLVSGAIALAVLNRVTVAALLADFFVVTVSAAVSFVVAGMAIAVKRPDLRIGWLLCAASVATAVPPFTAQYARYALITHPGGLPAGRQAAFVTVWDWPFGYALVLVGIALLFPEVQALTRRERVVAWLAAAATALLVAGNAVSPRPNQALPQVPNPYGLAGAVGVATAAQVSGSLLLLVAMMAALAILTGRFRRGTHRQRQQLRWFLLAFAVLAAAEILVKTFGPGPNGSTAVQSWAEAAAVPLLALAIGIAVLRHRLYDIDLLFNRTLVYLMMSGLVAGTYVVVVGYLAARLDVHGTWAALAATGLVAVGFNPVRERVQRGVNRLLYGRRDEPYAVLTELGRRLEATLSPEAVLDTIATSVREALGVPYASVTLHAADGAEVAAQAGTPGPVALRLPMTFGPEQVGELAVCGRQPGEPLGSADRRLLTDFARQAGAAAHAVRLTADLRSAQQRLLIAREEERRRIRRDLHDGLGPHLASQALTLDAARNLVRKDPAAAEAVLVELREQTQQAVAEIRRIVHGLRPAELDDRGLAQALQDHAARYTHTGLRVAISAPASMPVLPAAVDLAAYRIAAEAITNTARHAAALTCSVSLTADAEAGLVRLEVRDDGTGLPAGYQPGTGLASMRARAAELGGRCVIATRAGAGTLVIAELPLAAEAS